jgi:hypothetical protein
LPLYRFFDLTLDSECEIAGLPAGMGAADVSVGVSPLLSDDSSPWFQSPVTGLTVRRSPAAYLFEFPTGAAMRVDAGGSSVTIDLRGGSLDDALVYLLGPVLGFVLRLKGRVVFHGAALSRNESALALAGHSGAGKSTTAASLVARRFQLLSDNILPLRDPLAPMAVPGYPRIRLWPDSAQALSATELPRLTPGWDKRYLTVDANLAGAAASLRVLYLLEGSDAVTAPRVEPVDGAEAVMRLVELTYPREFAEPEMRQAALEFCARLSRSVGVRRVSFRRGLERIDEIADAIEYDFAAVTGGA